MKDNWIFSTTMLDRFIAVDYQCNLDDSRLTMLYKVRLRPSPVTFDLKCELRAARRCDDFKQAKSISG
jgi:hypothetical protein